MSSTIWPHAIDAEDGIDFVAQILEEWGDSGVDLEDVDLVLSFTLGQEDVGNTKTPYVIDVIAAAKASASPAGDQVQAAGPTDNPLIAQPSWPTTAPKNPILDGKPLPATMAILIGGVAVRVDVPPVLVMAGKTTTAVADAPLTQYNVDDAVLDALHGIQQAFDAGLIKLSNGSRRICQCSGEMTTSYGSSRIALVTPPVTNAEGAVLVQPIYSGQQLMRDRGWRKVFPHILGPEEQLAIEMVIPRSTPWPILAADPEAADQLQRRIRVTVTIPTLIARRSDGAGTGGVIARDYLRKRCAA